MPNNNNTATNAADEWEQYKVTPAASSVPSSFSTGISGPNQSQPSYQDMAPYYALKYNLDPDIFSKMIETESNWNPSAISPKGAIGLGQLMPGTASDMQVDPLDPAANLEGSAKYLSQLYQKYGSYDKALAAYNAGPGRVEAGGDLPAETQAYVSKILGQQQDEWAQYKAPRAGTTAPATTPPAASGAQTVPAAPSGPGAINRFESSATNTFGLPADVRDWPAAFRDMVSKGIPISNIPNTPGGIAAKGMFGTANALGNMIKGIAENSRAASQEGLDLMKQPGYGAKIGGVERFILGGIPQYGPLLVKWADQLEKGDVAGSMGTIAGMGLQGFMSMPDTVAAKLQGASQYLMAKSRVQETILASETQHMLNSTEASARAQGHSLFPSTDQNLSGATVAGIARKAIDDNIRGTPATPRPLGSMLEPEEFKKLGSIETPESNLMEIYRRMTSGDDIPANEVQGYRSEIGRIMARGGLEGDVYSTLKQTYNGLTGELDKLYASEGKSAQWEDANVNWKRLATTWWDKDSPLAQSMNARDATAILKPLLDDQSERATQYLKDYRNHGADPGAVQAAQTFYKGMNRMQFRGLWRAAGPLMVAVPLGYAAGVPYSATMGAVIVPLIMAKMGLGWGETRPSMIKILSNEPPTVPGQPWIPRQSPFTPYRPTNIFPSSVQAPPGAPSVIPKEAQDILEGLQ